jgi:LmbE family N-acetylglucosaminyl deacetylase
VPLEKWQREWGDGVIRLSLAGKGKESFNILCLGAHSDDIEIGCGGTLLQLKKSCSNLKFRWVVFTGAGARKGEARKGAELFGSGCETEVTLREFRDGFLPYNGSAVKDCFEELKGSVSPDLIFTHWQGDAHQDHRLISELTWNTFRNHLILEYEIPKYDGDMGRPNCFVPLDTPLYQQKVDHLLTAFESQKSKPWFQPETFLALMRLRGMESNSATGYAEAFHVRKLVLGNIA